MRRACAALMRDREQLRALRSFAEPILAEMADWPESQPWGDWLRALERLAPRVIAKPERVLRVLRELAPLAGHWPGAPSRSSRRADAAPVDADA